MSIKFLENNKILRLEKENTYLSNELAFFEDISLKGTAEGQAIDLSDSAEHRVKNIVLCGNSKQFATTGDQKFNPLSQRSAGSIETINGITFIMNNDGTITLNGTANGNAGFIISNNVQTILANNYYVNAQKISGSNVGNVNFLIYDSNYSNAKSGLIGENKIALENNMEYSIFGIRVESGTTCNNCVIGYIVGENAETYEPYTGGQASPNIDYEQEIWSCGDTGSLTEKITNRNYFNKENTPNYIKNVSLNDINTGVRVITTGANQQFTFAVYSLINLKGFEGKTIRMKAKYSTSSNNVAMYKIGLCNKNGENRLDGANSSQSEQTISFVVPNTLDENQSFLAVWLYANTNPTTVEQGAYVDYENIIITIGDDNMSYIEHQEQLYTIPCQKPMRAVEETQTTNLIKDEFVKQNGKWYEKHNIKKYIFTGNENWTLHTTTENFVRFLTVGVDFSDYQSSKGLCNKFFYNGTPGGISVPNAFRFAPSSNIQRVWICLPIEYNITTVDLLKAKLKELYDNGNPMYVLYYTDNPELIECTSTQTEALETLSKAKTYKNITHIYSEDEIKPNLSLTYYKDIDSSSN